MAGTAPRLRLEEPAVSLTDLALAIEAGVFALGIARYGFGALDTARSRSLRRWSVALFGAVAAASLAGAAVHAMSPSERSRKRQLAWRASLSSIAVASLSAWHLGASLEPRSVPASRLLLPVDIVHLAYVAFVWRSDPAFRSAVVLFTPGAFMLRLALLSRLRHADERRPAALAQAALAVSAAAILVQARGMNQHARWFDHNASFHVLEALAFALLYPALRGLLTAARTADVASLRG
jgi:hypothetical protein